MTMYEAFTARTRRVQGLMDEQQVDALLVLSSEDYFYFTGDTRRQPRVLIPRKGEPTLFVFASEIQEAGTQTWISDIRGYRGLHEMMLGIISILKEMGLEKPKVALEMEFATPYFLVERFKTANPTAEVVDAKSLVSPLRRTKDAEEVEQIQRAAELADLGIQTATEIIRAGMTELEVATEVEYALRKNGADRLAFPMFVNSGHRSLWLHGTATRKPIEQGDLIVVDIGPVHMGYCAEICRTFSVGEPSDEARHLYSLYWQMQRVALEQARPAVATHHIEAKIEEVLKGDGYEEYFIRGYLHGIGLAFEETPFPTIFPEDVLLPLEEGMTLAFGHPILSVPGIGGVRVEDTVLLEESGATWLTRSPRDEIIVV